MTRHRLVTQRVNLAVDDTNYTLTIPEGACSVRVVLNDATRAWRYSPEGSVAAAGSGMLVAAGGDAKFGEGPAQLQKTTLNVAVSAGGGVSLYAVMSCLVPLTR